MNKITDFNSQVRPHDRALGGAFVFLACLQIIANCHGQGTITFTFEGQAPGTKSQLSSYTESGMRFALPPGPGSLYLSGGGISGFPDNGTGYLEYPGSGLTFGFTNFLPTVYFNLVSFDAAEYGSLGSQTLTLVGYKPMAPAVTNFFTLDGVNDGTGPLQDFQTFNLDSSFVGLYRVDILNSLFSLDNVVVSGVPEPSAGVIALVGVLCVAGRFKLVRCSHRRELR